MAQKKIIITENMAKRLMMGDIINESNDDILKSRDLEKKIKDVTTDAIKNDKQLEKALEKTVRKIVADSINTLFRTLWQRRNFYEDSIKNDLY